MHVERAGVHRRVRGVAVHGAQQPAGGALHDRHRLTARAADVDVGPAAAGPVPPGGAAAQLPVGDQPVQRLAGRLAAEHLELVLGQRQLGGRAAQLGAEHVGVGRVGDGGLDGAAEHRLRVVGQVVVQRVVAGDEHHERLPLRAAGPAGLLPERGQRARVAGQQDGVQAGDVDAQLQGVGGRHPQQVTGRQRPLQLPALLGQVAAPVGLHPSGQVGPAAVDQDAAGLVGDRLGRAPRPHEGQRPGALLHQVGQQPGGVGGRGATQRGTVLPGPLGQRRLPQREGGPRAG